MEQMHSVLRPGGILLLAIPTATPTHTVSNLHRMYGADRLALLLEGRFSFLARVWVWEGNVFGGWVDVDKDPKLFPHKSEIKGIADWMNQHVLVLQKVQNGGRGETVMAKNSVAADAPQTQKVQDTTSSTFLLLTIVSAFMLGYATGQRRIKGLVASLALATWWSIICLLNLQNNRLDVFVES
mmetsp:Transcript_11798/g.16932  ORF Transcript_11798/g.16932 Transcript_11798/m.16932 type:complete len:183 (+) Transcript_11798:388-936(+)